jgi:hypothetical protein
MTAFNYAEAARDFQAVLDTALREDVLINHRDGNIFKIIHVNAEKAASPLDIEGINTKATTQDIIDALRDGRAGT